MKKFGALTEDVARYVISEVIGAIEYLHRQNILYRDLKCENIIICSGGHIKLIDFGLAKFGVHDYIEGATSFCGTGCYMPPEIVFNREYGKSVDIYLIGALLFELLTGELPFQAKASLQYSLNQTPPYAPQAPFACSAAPLKLGAASSFNICPETAKWQPSCTLCVPRLFFSSLSVIITLCTTGVQS